MPGVVWHRPTHTARNRGRQLRPGSGGRPSSIARAESERRARRAAGLSMQLHGHTIGVCSWSLQASGMADLVDKVKQTGLTHVQLALPDLLFLDDKQKHQELG